MYTLCITITINIEFWIIGKIKKKLKEQGLELTQEKDINFSILIV